MILVTGWSNDTDGIAFLAETDDPAEAFRMLLESVNADLISRFGAESTERYKLVTGNEGGDSLCPVTCLVWDDVQEEEFHAMIEETEHMGWKLCADPITVGKVLWNPPW